MRNAWQTQAQAQRMSILSEELGDTRKQADEKVRRQDAHRTSIHAERVTTDRHSRAV
jgi:hypothetical protein